MKTYVTKQLRERSSVRGKQKTWVSECTDDQLYLLYLKLRNGESAKSIAQNIQKAWKINPHSTVHSLSQGILKFKGRIQDLLEVEALPRTAALPPQRSPLGIEDLDDLMGLELVVRGQRERIARMMREERELGVKHSNLSRDIQSLAALSKQLTREKEFALRHKGRDPLKEREEELRHKKMDRQFKQMMKGLPNGGDGVIRAAERFLELVEQHAVPMVATEDENGNLIYQPIEKEDPDLQEQG